MLAGRLDEAVTLLEAATQQAPKSAPLLSDLAAAYLTRALEKDRPFDFSLAQEAADTAVTTNRDFLPAQFNRAMALDCLMLTSEAQASWRSYLNRDQTSGWSREAGDRLRDLEKPSDAVLWERIRPKLDSAALLGDEQTVRAVVTRFPQLSRLYCEEVLLPDWAEARFQGRAGAAARSLTIARAVGTVLSATSKDRMVADSVEAITKALAEPSGREATLVAGHRLFRLALDRYKEQRLKEARTLWQQSRSALATAASPFRAWVDFYLALCERVEGSGAETAALSALVARTPLAPYPNLQGRVLWLQALSAASAKRLADSIQSYRMAVQLFTLTGETENAASVHARLAEIYQLLGARDSAAVEGYKALLARPRIIDPSRLHVILYEAALGALAQGLPRLALYYEDEDVRCSRAWGNASALCDALVERSAIWRELDDFGLALRDLREAEANARSAYPLYLRTLHGYILFASGELYRKDPQRAARSFTEALRQLPRTGNPYLRAKLLVARSGSFLATGELELAEADLNDAIIAVENNRTDVEEERLRISYLDTEQPLYNDMISFQLNQRGNARLAFEYADRLRARVLLDRRGDSPSLSGKAVQPASADAVSRSLEQGAALIEYAYVRGELVAWVIDSRSMHMQRIVAGHLDTRLRILLSILLSRGSEEEFRQAAAELHSYLLRPLQAYLPPRGRLILVPDGLLARVPFPALFDAAAHRYLVEDYTITVVPSAALYLSRRPDCHRPLIPPHPEALLLGDPAFDRTTFPTLPRLPGAKSEIALIATSYTSSSSFTGSDVTRRTILEGLDHYDIIHLAGHGVINYSNPMLSVLPVAPSSTENDGGLLFAYQLSASMASRARLVVLSACNTASGPLSRSEGVLSLARPFLAAGVPAVIASLSEVDDSRSSALAVRLHRHLGDGCDPALALRYAQLEMLHSNDPLLSSPFAWGAFEVIGAGLHDRFQENP
jgi:CHAT domain-containing protein